jgi:hypothetical protein
MWVETVSGNLVSGLKPQIPEESSGVRVMLLVITILSHSNAGSSIHFYKYIFEVHFQF